MVLAAATAITNDTTTPSHVTTPYNFPVPLIHSNPKCIQLFNQQANSNVCHTTNMYVFLLSMKIKFISINFSEQLHFNSKICGMDIFKLKSCLLLSVYEKNVKHRIFLDTNTKHKRHRITRRYRHRNVDKTALMKKADTSQCT